jgi:hypothetical protein
MKYLSLVILLLSSSALADAAKFKVGDCVTDHVKAKLLFIKITNVDDKTQMYDGTLFSGKGYSQSFEFDLMFATQGNFTKITCPKVSQIKQ